ncbi:uncharacterized protein PpBr36_06480 [Pyricularia pennisetigena]|uniref:uncharacterized protein n=1 Tax=Pyricularia pennisetigena TaxID=1578925 RepID=UPI001153CBAA|nr:uncharacterized protein PpBr36_06480 [Pyricularia pennisetigena]TLS23246.1 hypothetical protein PpBr36_06480 [Pyricularia pennisetigena]
MHFTYGLAAVACLVGTTLGQAKVKFMPLGDSITEITCWRATVWDNLVSAGVASRTDFVGSSTTNPQNCQARDGNWNKRHEGHSGYQAVDIVRNNLPGWLNQNVPDVVNFMLGTNDVNLGNRQTSEILGAYTGIVQQLRAKNPRVKVMVDTVLPLPFKQAPITALNNAIPGWAAGLNTSQSPIVVVDVAAGYPTSALRDQVHPNAAGDAIIAAKISPVLIRLIKDVIAEKGL